MVDIKRTRKHKDFFDVLKCPLDNRGFMSIADHQSTKKTDRRMGGVGETLISVAMVIATLSCSAKAMTTAPVYRRL